MIHRAAAPLTGVLAVAAGLAVTELLAGLLQLRASPVVAMGEAVIAVTPGTLAHQIIAVVGHADKPLAIGGVVVVSLLLGAALGSLWARVKPLVLLAVGGFVALAAVAALSRPDTSVLTAWLCPAGGITTVAVLDRLNAGPASTTVEDPSRRTFLRNAAVVALGSVLVAGLGRWIGHSRAVVEQARSALRLPTSGMAVPAGAQLHVKGIGRWSTPPSDFYRIDTALTLPLIPPDEWRLRIHGMVERSLTLSYRDLLQRGLRDEWITLCCVSNEVGGDLIGNTIWSGVPIADLLAEAGIKPGADALLSTSVDGWTAGTPLAALTDGRNALLAVAMNGEPLPIEHGFPVRQVVPGLYGYVSATKWVSDWNITRFEDFAAYWTQRGWSERGPIKIESRIEVPTHGVSAGTVTVAGTAWAPHRGISAVELRVDGGGWQRARLAAVPNIDTWVQWVWDWEATPGEHQLQVRAIDATGRPQTAVRADVVPNGASGYHGRTVTVS